MSTCPDCGSDLSMFIPLLTREVQNDVVTTLPDNGIAEDISVMKSNEDLILIQDSNLTGELEICGINEKEIFPLYDENISDNFLYSDSTKFGIITDEKILKEDYNISDLDLSPLKAASPSDIMNPVIPLVASLTVSGLGQCLNGEPVKGILFIIGFWLMYLLANFGYPPLYILAFTVQVGGALQAYIHSRKVNAGLISPKNVGMRTVILYVTGYIAISISLFAISVMLIAVF